MAIVRMALETVERTVVLERKFDFERVPYVGELVRFEAPEVLPRAVTNVTHDENGSIEILLAGESQETVRATSYMDLERDVAALAASGWRVVSDSNYAEYE